MRRDEPDMRDLRLHQVNNREFKPGDLIVVLSEEDRTEWWWDWPGVVRQSRSDDDMIYIEFMGFGGGVPRFQRIDRRKLSLLSDKSEVAAARIHRVLTKLKLPTSPILGQAKPFLPVDDNAA